MMAMSLREHPGKKLNSHNVACGGSLCCQRPRVRCRRVLRKSILGDAFVLPTQSQQQFIQSSLNFGMNSRNRPSVDSEYSCRTALETNS